MGTLGQFLHDARVARGIDLSRAAHQTRISVQFLKALEAEDFSKLPGEVFVRGFLKNYGKFLNLDESEVMQKYGELRRQQSAASAPVNTEPIVAEQEHRISMKMPLEPFIWGAGIVVILVLLLFAALPERQRQARDAHQKIVPSPADSARLASETAQTTSKTDKLYLEVIALENTWLLVRTDTSPQKKAVLNKGESLIWSADESFLLSYGSAGAVKLLLNGQEIMVDEPRNAVVRDLSITATGIASRKIKTDPAHQARSKQKPSLETPVPQSPAAPLRERRHRTESQPYNTDTQIPGLINLPQLNSTGVQTTRPDAASVQKQVPQTSPTQEEQQVNPAESEQ